MAGLFRDLKNGVKEVASTLYKEAPKVAKQIAGIKTRERQYSGSVRIRNDLLVAVRVAFSACHFSDINSKELFSNTLEPSAECSFDPDESADFDYLLFVSGGDSHHVLRSGSYSISPSEPKPVVVGASSKSSASELHYTLQSLTPRETRCSDLLESAPGLSFSFSASGWLFIYQMGVAECLQNHGITRNPHVRISGASGGALTAVSMMYGADMRMLKEHVKECASSTHSDISQAINLRSFVLEAMKLFAKDGSFMHPAFQTQRVEVAISEAAAGRNMGLSFLTMKTKARRLKEFASTADIAIALLASSSMGISGLPFEMTTKDGEQVKVADGGMTQFLPVIDEWSIKVKPFSDLMNLMSGGEADITPTEFVPGNFGLYPGSCTFVDHLYELGYQDMEAWLDKNFADRVDKVSAALSGPTPPLPPVAEFHCTDDGMQWYDEVTRKVPVSWSDQRKGKKFHQEAHATPEGEPGTQSSSGYAAKPVAAVPQDAVNAQ